MPTAGASETPASSKFSVLRLSAEQSGGVSLSWSGEELASKRGLGPSSPALAGSGTGMCRLVDDSSGAPLSKIQSRLPVCTLSAASLPFARLTSSVWSRLSATPRSKQQARSRRSSQVQAFQSAARQNHIHLGFMTSWPQERTTHKPVVVHCRQTRGAGGGPAAEGLGPRCPVCVSASGNASTGVHGPSNRTEESQRKRGPQKRGPHSTSVSFAHPCGSWPCRDCVGKRLCHRI